jgi:hypothetical protein
MAGFKQTQIDDDAVSLWTFDGDAFDSGSRKLIVPPGEPNYIIDEIDNLNPAILHNDNETYPGYRLGMPSLVDFEQTDQQSMSFAFAGRQPAHPNQWAKTYLEVPHTLSYAFPRYGAFSVEFLFFKASSWDEGTSAYSSYTRPIISKSGVFDIYFSFPYSDRSRIIASTPAGNVTAYHDITTSYNLIGTVNHYVLVWENLLVDNGQYRGTASVYVNGYLVGTASQTYFDVFPNTNLNNPILIAGRTGSNRQSDYHTSDFRLDQIAIYDRALSSDEVSNHFSKIFPYDKMIAHEFASSFWTFADTDSTIDFTVYPAVGGLQGTYLGVRNFNFHRGVDGPDNLMGSKAASFGDGGMASFISVNQYNTYLARQINSAYSYEAWFAVSSLRRAVLLAAQELAWPFDGPLIQINMRDNQEFIGCLQFTEGDNGAVLNSRYLNDNNSRFLFNDGNWHHIVILRRSNGMMELWLDGILHDSSIEATRSVGQPGQLVVMNSLPGQLNCNGSICKLAYYGYALQAQQIKNHYTYTVTYRIRGIVTLLGVPYQATLRFYNSYTGAFVQELISDPNTGEYEAIFYNNANIDILVFSASDLSVRYRAYGPVTPSEFIDLPVNL